MFFIKKCFKVIICFWLIYFLMLIRLLAISIVYDVQTLDFLQKVTNPIIKSANLAPNSISLYLVNDDNMNAFVAGGQNIFINTGLISAADNYDEIAGVIAHEMGHITNGHLVASQSNMNKQKIPLFVGILTGIAAAIASPEAGILLATGSTQIATGNILANSREHENEADLSSIQYIKDSGYSLYGMYTFMGKLYKQQEIKELDPHIAWTLTHPLSYDRMMLMQRNLKYNNAKVNSNKELEEEFLLIKAKLNGLTLNKQQLQNQYSNNLNSKYYFYALSISEFNHKNFNQAFMAIEKALNLSNNNVYIKETKANYLLDLQKFKEAEKLYKEITKQNKNFYYYYMLSYTQYSMKEYNESLVNINIATNLYKSSPVLWKLKAMVYSKTGKQALSELATAEKLLLMQDYKNALQKAQVALPYLEKDSQYYQDAKYIIENSQNNLK